MRDEEDADGFLIRYGWANIGTAWFVRRETLANECCYFQTVFNLVMSKILFAGVPRLDPSEQQDARAKSHRGWCEIWKSDYK